MLTDDEMRAFADALASLEADRTATVAAVRFLALSGLRISEAVGIRWEHVGADGVLLLPSTKTGRRTHPLPPVALTLLASIERSGPFVVQLDRHRRRCGRRTPASALTGHAPFAGIEGARPHDLRRGVIARAARSRRERAGAASHARA